MTEPITYLTTTIPYVNARPHLGHALDETLRMTPGSSMVASTRMRPPHRGHAKTSTANVWR